MRWQAGCGPCERCRVGSRMMEIAELVTRGGGFLSSGDIASAQLFYERAADAGNGSAVLQLGASCDPGFLTGRIFVASPETQDGPHLVSPCPRTRRRRRHAAAERSRPVACGRAELASPLN